jgi:hypothetical protein
VPGLTLLRAGPVHHQTTRDPRTFLGLVVFLTAFAKFVIGQVGGSSPLVGSIHIVIDFFIAGGHDRVPTEKVDRHSLDGTNADEVVPRLRIGQIGAWQKSCVELLVLVKISPLESLAVNFEILSNCGALGPVRRAIVSVV